MQYSEKGAAAGDMEREALAIKELCRGYGAMFIVNDDVRLACRVESDGIHLGQGDMHISIAARIFRGKVIGVTVESPRQAIEAEVHGASYIGVTIFSSTTNRYAMPVGLEGLTAIRASSSLPIYAIGGGCHRHMDEIRAIGANGIAVISAISASVHAPAAAAKLVSGWDKAHPAFRALRKG